MKPYVYLLTAAAYLYGSVPFGFLLAKALRGVDLREAGSGSIGATNAARVLGPKFFPIVFVLDFSKGFLAALAGTLLAGRAGAHHPPLLAVISAAAAILGHVFPVYLGFRGGKAVAAGAGACAVLAPPAVIAAAVVWGLIYTIWRYVSLASMCAAVSLVAAVLFVYPDPFGVGLYRTIFAMLAATLVLVRHRANVKRLLAGTESKFGQRGPSGVSTKDDEETAKRIIHEGHEEEKKG